tara:strand:- start:2656 stop:3099 length:444 start_codon:yes stop_codon:yes gene_type:complete
LCTIDIATLSDLAALMEIEQASHFHPWKPSIMERYLKQGTVVAMRCDGILTGFAIVTVVAGDAELLNIAVAPAARGMGYAKQLMAAVEEKASSQQAERIFLEVRASNVAAIGLYEQHGYCQTGVRPRYYPAPEGREDAWLYCQELTL